MGKRRVTLMIDDNVDKKILNRVANRLVKTKAHVSYSQIVVEILKREFKLK
jgi:hypothetical protein